MNKSAEQQAEEKYPHSDFGGIRLLQTSMNENRNRYREGFVEGHHSRDEEVKKLVEVLDELLKDRIWEPNWDKAKEAIKPYQP